MSIKTITLEHSKRIDDLKQLIDREQEPNKHQYYLAVLKQLQTQLEPI